MKVMIRKEDDINKFQLSHLAREGPNNYFFVVGRGISLYRRMFSSTVDLHTVDASGIPSCDSDKCL